MTRNFWIIALISLINSLSLTILIPVIYLYGRQFGLNDFQTSLLFSIYSIAQFFCDPCYWKVVRSVWAKTLARYQLTGNGYSELVGGNCNNCWCALFARFLDGITGGNASVAQAVISDVTTSENRARGFGINAAAFGLGFVLGPVISLLAQQISLGTSFLVSSAIAFVAFLITIFFLPETIHTRASKAGNIFDLGLGNLVKGLAFPKVGILLIINFFIGTTFTIFTYAFQPYFIHVLKQNNQTLTLMFLMFGVLGVVMQTWGVSLLTQKFNLVHILFLGLAVRSLSFVLMPIWANVIYFVIVAVIYSLFNSLVQPMINALISLNTSPEDQGTALGLNASYLSVSNAFGPVIAGTLIHQSNPATYAYPLYLAGILTFFVLGLAIATRQRYQVKLS